MTIARDPPLSGPSASDSSSLGLGATSVRAPDTAASDTAVYRTATAGESGACTTTAIRSATAASREAMTTDSRAAAAVSTRMNSLVVTVLTASRPSEPAAEPKPPRPPARLRPLTGGRRCHVRWTSIDLRLLLLRLGKAGNQLMVLLLLLEGG